MIKVLVAEDNIEQNIMLSNFLTKDEEIKLIGMTFNGLDTINSYISNKPDILILDIKIPKMNGIEVLNALDKIEDEKEKCNVILTTGELTEYFPQKLNKVYALFSKPFDFNTLLHSIHQIYNNSKKTKPDPRKICNEIFQKLGFDLFKLGTKLLEEAVIFSLGNPECSNNLYEIYKNLSKKTKIPPNKIKWKIDNTINSMYRFTSKKTIKEVFCSYDGRKPTTKYIIFLVISKIKYGF